MAGQGFLHRFGGMTRQRFSAPPLSSPIPTFPRQGGRSVVLPLEPFPAAHEPDPMNLAPHPATADPRATLLTWGPIVAGLGFMYGPSFVDLFRGIWSTDEQAHGPTPHLPLELCNLNATMTHVSG